MKWKCEGVEGVAGEVKELTGTDIERGGAIGGFGPQVKFVWKTGSNGERSAEAIVDGDAKEMFALAVSFDDALKVFIAGAAGNCLETFLEALCESGGAAGEVIAEIAALCADLVGSVKKRDTNDADGEWKHKLEGGAHAEASERD